MPKKTASRKDRPMNTEERRSYELAVVVSSKVKAEKRQSVIDAISKAVKNQDGTVTEVEVGGLKDLAYPIRHEQTGWYAYLTVSLPSSSVQNVESLIRQHESILRHLFIRKP
jgi:small subunit ribosomal protein S6